MADTKRNDPVLDITTQGLGTPVRIDGQRYFIRHPSKLTLEQQIQLEQLMPRTGELMTRARTLLPAETSELSGILHRLCQIILDAPPKVHKALNDTSRVALLEVFIDLRPTPARRTGATTPTPRRSTGATSSRASRGSTAGRPTAGSVTSRSGS